MSPQEASSVLHPFKPPTFAMGSAHAPLNMHDAMTTLRERVNLAGDRAARIARTIQQAQAETYGFRGVEEVVHEPAFEITVTGQLAYLECQLDRLEACTARFSES